MSRSLDDACRDALGAWNAAGLLREPPLVTAREGARIRVGGRDYVDFSSNDYMGLASSPALHEALSGAVGLGAGASRLVTGEFEAHRALERDLAAWVRRDDALVVGAGFALNAALFSALCGDDDFVFSDALNHASLIDGMRLCGARRFVFAHNDMDSLEARLREAGPCPGRRWIVTESVFSMDGDGPDLGSLRELAMRYDCAVVIDEAHALGVLGPEGAGRLAEAQWRSPLVLGTFGKAFGAQGAFVAGSASVVAWLRQRLRAFVYSTGVFLPLCAVLHAGLAVLKDADRERGHLLGLAGYLETQLRERAFHVKRGRLAAVVPLELGDIPRALALSASLKAAGFWVQAIRPPTVPQGSARLRWVLSAAHTRADVDAALRALDAASRELG